LTALRPAQPFDRGGGRAELLGLAARAGWQPPA
jgi:hypothetical protein